MALDDAIDPEIGLRIRRLWIALAVVCGLSFTVLGYYGRQIYRQAPPIPQRVMSSSGELLFTGEDIRDGQNVWQSIGGQEVGSVWGHGGYTAPDWTADWLHRESVWLLERWAQARFSAAFDALAPMERGALTAELQAVLRVNTYDSASGDLVVPDERALAIAAVGRHYHGLFRDDPELAALRVAYAIPASSVSSDERMDKMVAFLFWATWATTAERPGDTVSYTNNWPPEPLAGNTPSTTLVVWTGISVIALLIGIGLIAGRLAAFGATEEEQELVASDDLPGEDPIAGLASTPSMRATAKYFWVAIALLLVQIGMGIVAAHYGVEGDGFYGIPLAEFLPYSLSRTWHVQLGIFWIATAWLAAGLYMAPAISGVDPPGQALGVNVLFGALVLVVGGSMLGHALGIHQQLDLVANFWLGHQGYEYVELGRLWQLALFAGLLLWLWLMARAMIPAIRRADSKRSLLVLFLVSCAAIALFWGAGLMWGRQTNLAIAEYWRWWVVHLWVEGFFEVFAAVVTAFLFVRLGLLRAAFATRAILFSTLVFLFGGILGTFHHLYFSGTPTGVLAVGATFSALEVVPLVLIGFEAFKHLRLYRAAPWVRIYRWPIYFLLAVAFWNLLGAGVFGFLINPPIALYYMQGLNTTPLHGHTALFGVYGMLGIALILICLRGLDGAARWNERPLAIAFWALNGGLLAMGLLSLFPVGLLQTVASIEHGLWYARSVEFLQTDTMQLLRWFRVIGDTVFAVGVAGLVWFLARRKAP